MHKKETWDCFYQQGGASSSPLRPFEWFFGYPAVSELLLSFLEPGPGPEGPARVLDLGCGTSDLGPGLYRDSARAVRVLYIQAFVLVFLLGKFMRKVFFGQLRAAEMEHLIERSWYAVTETCLAFTVFRDDFSPRFVALFTLLLFLKCFHWLAEDRVDFVLYIQAFVLVFLLGKFMRKVFFGQLRAAEMEHLIERSWYAVTETCLAFTVFRDDFSPRFVALFTLLLFLKCFHWLAEDRVDFMERSPNISWLFHFRVLSLMVLLGILDFLFVSHACHSIITRGASVQLVFGFEYAILLTMVLTTFIKYALHTADLQSENPWDNKAVYMLYTELFTGEARAAGPGSRGTGSLCPSSSSSAAAPRAYGSFIKVLLYMAFMTIMIKVHTFPLFAIRPMYLAMRSVSRSPPPLPPPLPPALSGRGAQRVQPVWEGAPWLGMPPPPPFGLSPPPAPPAGFSGLSEEELAEMEQEGRRGLEARLQCLQNIHTLLDAAMLQINHPPRPAPTSSAPAETASSQVAPPSGPEESSSQSAEGGEPLEGAVGFSVPESVSPGELDDRGEGEEDGEPDAAELRRRRLRKLETAPPADH
ncbi:SYVN1 ligase, partial [Atractosteus spatula]|nr:SYVN1 ligase [Atractosteus spatula]